MKPIAKVYFDCEFTGLKKDTDLISMGLTSPLSTGEGYNSLYIEFTDYDKNKVTDDWIQRNVINHLMFNSEEVKEGQYFEHKMGKLRCYKCSKDKAKSFIFDFLQGVYEAFWDECPEDPWENDPQVQMVSDVCHYDFVLFLDLFGTALDLPSFISPVCLDINSGIAKFCGIRDTEAFDMSREKLASILADMVDITHPELFINSDINELPEEIRDKKHNALYDAFIIRKIDTCLDHISTLPFSC